MKHSSNWLIHDRTESRIHEIIKEDSLRPSKPTLVSQYNSLPFLPIGSSTFTDTFQTKKRYPEMTYKECDQFYQLEIQVLSEATQKNYYQSTIRTYAHSTGVKYEPRSKNRDEYIYSQ